MIGNSNPSEAHYIAVEESLLKAPLEIRASDGVVGDFTRKNVLFSVSSINALMAEHLVPRHENSLAVVSESPYIAGSGSCTSALDTVISVDSNHLHNDVSAGRGTEKGFGAGIFFGG